MSDMYVLSCANVQDGGGIYKYCLENGMPRQDKYLACDRPMYSIMKEKVLHTVLKSPFEGEEISGYTYCDAELGNSAEPKRTLGVCACHLCVSGEDHYIVNYLSGNVVKNCEKEVHHFGMGVNLPRQDGPHTHFVCFTPDEKYVLCTDLGLDTIFVYDRALQEISTAKVPAGYGVRHLIFSADGSQVYAVNELKASVSVFDYEAGMLCYCYTVMLEYSDMESTAAAIRISKDGKLLYVSVRGEDALYVLSTQGERLQVLQKVSCGGKGPRDFIVTDELLICCNEQSDNTVAFSLDQGMVGEKKWELQLKAPLCVLTV